MDLQVPDALQGASAEFCGGTPGLQGTLTGATGTGEEEAGSPFFFSVPGRSVHLLRTDHPLQNTCQPSPGTFSPLRSWP